LDALKDASLGKKQFKKFNEVDVLVIDEISMVPNLDFERLNEVMKYSRSAKRNGERPFGGVQVVVTGDVSRTMETCHIYADRCSFFNLLPLTLSSIV